LGWGSSWSTSDAASPGDVSNSFSSALSKSPTCNVKSFMASVLPGLASFDLCKAALMSSMFRGMFWRPGNCWLLRWISSAINPTATSPPATRAVRPTPPMPPIKPDAAVAASPNR
jgi:hypothetical protein